MNINYQKELQKINNIIKIKEEQLSDACYKLSTFPDSPKILRPIIVICTLLREIIINNISLKFDYLLLLGLNIFLIEITIKAPFKIIKSMYNKEIKELRIELDNLNNKKIELENIISKEDDKYSNLYNLFVEASRKNNTKSIKPHININDKEQNIKVKKLVKKDDN